MARCPLPGSSARTVCPCCLHPASSTGTAGAAEQARNLRPSVRASAETLLQIARDPKHLGAEIGFFSILHTWNQQLLHHPHVHCVVPAGGLSPDHSRWIPAANNFFLPVKVLSRVFRGKFVAGLRKLHSDGKLGFHGKLIPLQSPKAFSAMLRDLFRTDWVVYSKRPFRSAEHRSEEHTSE